MQMEWMSRLSLLSVRSWMRRDEMLTMVNSSSMAITTSTASSESKPRSVVKDEVGETCRMEHERKHK